MDVKNLPIPNGFEPLALSGSTSTVAFPLKLCRPLTAAPVQVSIKL